MTNKRQRNPKYRPGHFCEVCGAALLWSQTFPSRIKKGYGRFCSRECHGQWRSENLTGDKSAAWKGGKVERVCKVCNKTFTVASVVVKKGRGRFCSIACRGQGQSKNAIGENAPNWLGGKSFEPYPPAFNTLFKRKIRARDNYTCALCGNPGRCVHHINYIKDDTTPGNCITLCRSCHTRTNANRPHWQRILTKIAQERAHELLNLRAQVAAVSRTSIADEHPEKRILVAGASRKDGRR